jgi:hypothetical protein
MGLRIQRGRFIKTRIVLFLAIAFALLAQPFFTHFQTFKAYADESSPQAPRFINGPHYVKAGVPGNDAGIAAEIEFDAGTSRLELNIDDTAVNSGGSPEEYGATPGANKINLHIGSLEPGKHTISGTATVNGTDVQIQGGPAIVYALDMPIAEYITPTDAQQAFKPSDNPVKVKINDEFSQFTDAELDLYKVTPENPPGEFVQKYTFLKDDQRSDCDPTGDGFVYCNIDRAPEWAALGEGTYFVKLKTYGIQFSDSAYWSHSFTIDKTPPPVKIDGPFSVIGGETVALNGTIDLSAIEATVYVDGKPDGTATLDGTGKWTYDLKANLSLGDHKVSVSAKDSAENTSDPEASVTTLTVQPFMPPAAAVTPVVESAIGLTDPFPMIKESEAELNKTAVAKTGVSDIAALDKKTTKDPAVDQNVVPIAATSEGWKLFGIAWYWLLLIPAVFGGAVWIIGRIRTPQTVPSFIADSEDI